MSFTQTDLDKINAAIAKGARKFQKDGRMIEYHSIEDMIKARDAIREEIYKNDAAANGVMRPRSYRSRTRKGL
jgi:roadblock/LC7 domain-containing protein